MDLGPEGSGLLIIAVAVQRRPSNQAGTGGHAHSADDQPCVGDGLERLAVVTGLLERQIVAEALGRARALELVELRLGHASEDTEADEAAMAPPGACETCTLSSLRSMSTLIS